MVLIREHCGEKFHVLGQTLPKLTATLVNANATSSICVLKTRRDHADFYIWVEELRTTNIMRNRLHCLSACFKLMQKIVQGREYGVVKPEKCKIINLSKN
jgi:hypothetical protein